MALRCAAAFAGGAALAPIARAQDSLPARDSARAPAARDSTARSPIEINGLLQLWFLAGHTITTAHDTYRVRRADLKFGGVLTPRVRWRVSVDAAKLLSLTRLTSGTGDSTVIRDVSVDQRGRILQEASIAVALDRYMRLDVGQQIIPLALEGTIPSGQIETIQRTMFIEERGRGGTLGDIRDVGASLRGTVARGVIDYHVGTYNEMGESQNATDQNDQKAAIGHLIVHVPGIAGVQLGASGGFEGGALPQRRERAGGEAQLRRGALTVRGEVMGARDGDVRRLGWYGLAAARVAPSVQLVGRWDDWDPDLHRESSVADLRERQLVAGANWFFDGEATRFAVNVVRSSFPSGAKASTQLLLALQASW